MYVWVCGWVVRKIYVSSPSTNSCYKFNYTFLLGRERYGSTALRKTEPITTLLHVINFIETFKGNIVSEFKSWWDTDDINDDGKHWMYQYSLSPIIIKRCWWHMRPLSRWCGISNIIPACTAENGGKFTHCKPRHELSRGKKCCECAELQIGCGYDFSLRRFVN